MPATDDYLRQPQKMHRWFLGSAVVMFIAFIWMTAADHSREWKGYQSDVFRHSDRDTRARAGGVRVRAKPSACDRIELGDRSGRQAQEGIGASNETIDASARENTKPPKRHYDLMGRQVKSTRAQRDVARANYDLGVRDAALQNPNWQKLKAIV